MYLVNYSCVIYNPNIRISSRIFGKFPRYLEIIIPRVTLRSLRIINFIPQGSRNFPLITNTANENTAKTYFFLPISTVFNVNDLSISENVGLRDPYSLYFQRKSQRYSAH